MIVNRYLSLVLSAAIVAAASLAVVASGGPGWCAEATQEQNLALLKQIEADLAKSPNDITFKLQHAAMMGRLKRYEQQVVEADNLLKRDPRLREAYVIRSDGQANQQRYAEAIASLDKAFALGAPTPKLLLFKGSYLKNEKRYKEAIETLTQVIDAEPTNVIAYNFRSVCYFQLNGPCEQALHDMEKVVLLDPSDLKAGSLVADLKRELRVSSGNVRCAEATQEQNLALLKEIDAQLVKKPGDVLLQLQHAEVLGKLHRYEDEVVEANQMLMKNSKLRDAYLIRAHGEGNLNRYNDAVVSLDKAFQLGPPTIQLLLAKASNLKSLKRYLEAIAVLDQVLKASPSEPDAYLYRAFCYHQLYGPTLNELHDLEALSRLQPSNEKIQILIPEIRKSLQSTVK